MQQGSPPLNRPENDKNLLGNGDGQGRAEGRGDPYRVLDLISLPFHVDK
jgi:hypothetical protein